MASIGGIVFDLDDTLYFESDYVLSGFRYVAGAVGELCGGWQKVDRFLCDQFRGGVRGTAFDRLIAQFPSIGAFWNLDDLIQMYRSHEPNLSLMPPLKNALLSLLSDGVRLALITDGPVASQVRKIRALGIEGLFVPRIITDEWGVEFRKPNPRAFQTVAEAWGETSDSIVYVGDNPGKDFHGPSGLGWKTVRLRIPGQLHYLAEAPSASYEAGLEFQSASDLAKWLVTTYRQGKPGQGQSL